jgi:NAD-dependent deacetylase
MFGEPIPEDVITACERETCKTDCLLSVGTSAFVYPSAGFAPEVKHKGGAVIEVDPYETAITPLCDVSVRGKAGEVLPRLVASVKRAVETRDGGSST